MTGLIKHGEIKKLIKHGEIKNPIYVHETAIIDPGAKIGSDTKIWHWTHVMSNAIIGKDCTIGQNCFIAGQIGNGCKIQNNVSIYKGVDLYDNVFVANGVKFCNIKYPRANIEQKDKFMSTIVKSGVTIGTGAIILPGLVIGENAMVGAGAVVTKNVPAGEIWCGNPAKRLIYGENVFYCYVRRYGRFDYKCEDSYKK
uniref:Putative acetyltransferase n=1 Tax=viral metagenome TaxID=1070528 RepID=A0A6M3IY98_9ZZZZ